MSEAQTPLPAPASVWCTCMRRMLLRLPLVLAGWSSEQQTVKLQLFKKYRERPDMPFCMLKAALQVSLP